mgnify:CR=1 FL=1
MCGNQLTRDVVSAHLLDGFNALHGIHAGCLLGGDVLLVSDAENIQQTVIDFVGVSQGAFPHIPLDLVVDIDQATGVITNTKDKAGDVPVSKVWVNETDDPNPTSVTAQLLRNGAVYMTMELNEANEWKHTFTNLPLKDADGNDYTYVLDEDPVPGYTTAIDQDTGVITNSKENAGDVPVSKKWVNNTDDKDPASVTVHLLRNGAIYKTVHDARKKLRAALAARGIAVSDAPCGNGK